MKFIEKTQSLTIQFEDGDKYEAVQLVKSMFEFAKGCRCTHICFLNMSVAHDKKTLFRVPYHFLSSLKKRVKFTSDSKVKPVSINSEVPF